ncbi:MAG: hypothetical protein AMXMBFR33_68120 [Candidatus Xenobia bacterium]
MIANQIWQTYRYRATGLEPDYGTDHRGFWYIPLVATLARAGLLSQLDLEWEPPELAEPGLEGAAGLYLLYQTLLGELIGDEALFTFRELGFRDPRPDLRSIGRRRPEVVLVAEKTSLIPFVQRISEELGISTLILGGLPALVSTEFFASALPTGLGRLRVIAYVDFDPGGWIAAESFAGQLRRFGLECTEPEFVVRPERFTREEIELYSIPIPTPTPQIEGKVRAWLARSGGIEGEARVLHADRLRPVERVLEAVREILA